MKLLQLMLFIFVVAVALGLSVSPRHADGAAVAGDAKPVWSGVDKPLIVGELEVTVVSAKVGPVMKKDVFGEVIEHRGTHLQITITIKNSSKTARPRYKTWGGDELTKDIDCATATDDRNNVCRRVPFTFLERPIGRALPQQPLEPGVTLSDLLVFEVPADAAKTVRLELPHANLGIKERGAFRFEIPRKFWTAPR